jgi:hypothetical protein
MLGGFNGVVLGMKGETPNIGATERWVFILHDGLDYCIPRKPQSCLPDVRSPARKFIPSAIKRGCGGCCNRILARLTSVGRHICGPAPRHKRAAIRIANGQYLSTGNCWRLSPQCCTNRYIYRLSPDSRTLIFSISQNCSAKSAFGTNPTSSVLSRPYGNANLASRQ